MKAIYSNSIHKGAKEEYRREQQEPDTPQKTFRKVVFHVKLYNYIDNTFTLYVRNNESQARELAEEKLKCPQVKNVVISKVLILETVMDTMTWDLSAKC